MNWFIWQSFSAFGFIASDFLPQDLPINFLSTIALITLVVPMLKNYPMLVAAIVAMATVIGMHELPFRLGFLFSIMCGMLSGFYTEKILRERNRDH